MKSLKSAFLICTAIIASTLFLSSCTKAYELTEDSVQSDATTEKISKLTEKTWMVDELREKDLGTSDILVYKRGGTSNLVDIGQIRFKFNQNNTVDYTDYTGIKNSNITWKAMDGFSKLLLIEKQSSDSLEFTNVSFSGNTMTYKITDANTVSTYKMIHQN